MPASSASRARGGGRWGSVSAALLRLGERDDGAAEGRVESWSSVFSDAMRLGVKRVLSTSPPSACLGSLPSAIRSSGGERT
jgi:hypothetical protein